ncbi:MAG: pyridoxal phosphate-dependent aminotransferase [Candidatus Methanogasteraceae archaeon]
MQSDTTRFAREHVKSCTPCMHGGRVAERSGKPVLDFSVNLNPLGPPDIPVAIRGIARYPDNSYSELRNAIADFVERYLSGRGKGRGGERGLGGGEEQGQRITADNIIPANGSSELIRLFAETMIERGDSVIIPAPTFDEYEFQCRLFGADVTYCDYFDILELSTEDISNATAVFLCNPNNPTGDMIARKDVQRLAERCSDCETFLIVDEAFIELSDPTQSIAHAVRNSGFVFVLRSLTKVFAIPGLRLGFGIASEKLAELLNRARLVWNVGVPIETIGIDMMRECRESDYLERSVTLIREEREYLERELVDRGLSPHESSVNFILVDISYAGMDSRTMVAGLLDRGILVRDCSMFQNLDYHHIRIAVRNRAENRSLMRALDSVIG